MVLRPAFPVCWLWSLLSNFIILDDSLFEVLDDSVDAEAEEDELGWKLEFSSCLSNWFLASSLFSEEGELDDPEPDLGDPPVEEDLVGCTETEIKRKFF